MQFPLFFFLHRANSGKIQRKFEEDGKSFELLQVLHKFAEDKPTIAKGRKMVNEENRLMLHKDENSGTWHFARLLGAVSKDDVRIAAYNRKAVFRETYYLDAVRMEIVFQEDLVDSVRERSAYLLKKDCLRPLQSKNMVPIEPNASLRHSHPDRFIDHWAQCSKEGCNKWRIVPYDDYCEARKPDVCFECPNGCDVPHTDEELAGIEQFNLM